MVALGLARRFCCATFLLCYAVLTRALLGPWFKTCNPAVPRQCCASVDLARHAAEGCSLVLPGRYARRQAQRRLCRGQSWQVADLDWRLGREGAGRKNFGQE